MLANSLSELRPPLLRKRRRSPARQFAVNFLISSPHLSLSLPVTFELELTDLFGGQANYSWVEREKLSLPSGSSDLAIVRAAKKAMGLSGIRCRREDLGEIIALYPYGSLTVLFISPLYS